MMNLKSYPNSCIDIYLNAVKQKETKDISILLQPFESFIKLSYEEFQIAHTNNTLQDLVPNNKYDIVKTELKDLYSFQSKIIRALRETINNQQIHKITTTCQNCTINSVNSMDHILGQNKFPEFSVNALNLFPSCTECNSYKGVHFMKGAHKRFLNLYLDNLPTQQYLFADIIGTNDNIDFQFTLKNENYINEDLFEIIENHYKYLHLFKRMKLKASESYVSELQTIITTSLKHLDLKSVIKIVKENALQNMNAFGRNHFKYILEMALVESPIFLSQFHATTTIS